MNRRIWKYLFLDLDGVLNSTRYWSDSDRHLPMGKAGALDPAAVERLNQIVERTGCEVVLSSSWRGRGSLRVRQQVEGMLRERGYRHTLHGSTRLLYNGERWREVDEWLHVNRSWAPTRFVVLDDDLDAWSAMSRFAACGCFVNTNYLVGLQDDGVERAVEWLNG